MNKTGGLLYHMRTQKGVKQAVLCSGLCSAATLSRIERGDSIPDRLLFQALLLRLGLCPEEFMTLLSAQEYNYFQWRKKVWEALRSENWEDMKILLSDPAAGDKSCNPVLQEQFCLLMRSVLSDRTENDMEKSLFLLLKAIRMTVPGYKDEISQGWLLSTQEMGMFILLTDKLTRKKERIQARRLLSQLLSCVQKQVVSDAERIKILPDLACLKIRLAEEYDKDDTMELCRSVLKLVRLSRKHYGITQLMQYLIENMPETKERLLLEKQLEAYLEVYREYGCNPVHHYAFFRDANQEVYLIHELVRRYRQISAMTQEEISEGICSPETMSRIENGRQIPRGGSLERIAKKIGLDRGYYEGRLDTTNYEVLELNRQCENAGARGDLDTAWNLYCQLKEKLMDTTPKNRQHLISSEADLLYRRGKIDEIELIRRKKRALQCTIPDLEKDFWKRSFTKNEGEIIAHMAIGLRKLKRTEEAVEILEKLYKNYEDSEVNIDDQWHVMEVVRGGLCNYLSDIGRNEEAVKWGDDGLYRDLCNGTGGLAPYVMNITFAREYGNTMSREECKRHYIQAYYLCRLFCLKEHMTELECYLKNRFDYEVIC